MPKHEKIKKEHLTPKEALAIGTAALAFLGVVYEGGKNYGYHPDKNPSPPAYLETHNGVNPADILPSDTSK